MLMLVRQLWRLLHSWWRNDRIRVSPAEGQLLRLVPPCYLIINGQPVEIVGRTGQDSGRDQVVSYACRCGAGDGLLSVQRAIANREPVIIWQHQGAVARLLAAQIEVYPAG